MVGRYLDLRFPGAAPPAGLARAIHRRTDGNPLFMVNVVDYLASRDLLRPAAAGGPDRRGAASRGAAPAFEAALAEVETGVPESLRRMIEKQFERLSPEEQAVLEAASVAGVDFSPIAPAAGLGTDAARVEAVCEGLAARGAFLRAAGARRLPEGTVAARFAFIHPLYLNVLYDLVPPARRLRMHQRIAERGIAIYGERADEIAAELAVHFEQARDYAAAVRHLRQAAENAVRRYAYREAIDHLTRAFDLVGKLPEADRGPLRMAILERCGTVRRAMGNMRGAADDLEALVALARDEGRPDIESRGLFFLGSALAWFDRGRFEAAAGAAETLARRLPDPLLRAHTRGYAAYWNLLLRGRREQDARACAAALRRARRAGDRRLTGQHLVRHAYFQCLRSRYAAGCRDAREAMRLALEVGDGFDYLLCRFFLGWGLLHAGDWGAARRALEEGIRMAERNGHRLWATLLRLEMAWLHLLACDFGEARRLCEQSLAEARDTRHPHGECASLVLLGAAWIGLRQPGRAARCFEEAGDPGERRRVLMDWSWQMPLSLWLGDGWLALGDAARARGEAERLLDLAAASGERTYLALARRNLALLEAAAGRGRRAAAQIAGALRALRGVDAPVAAWQVYGAAARLRGGRGRSAGARHRRAGAAAVRRLSDALAPAAPLRRTFLASPEVQEVMRGGGSRAAGG
jgi:tetratricopeptide (TPR) repeat protein